MVIHFQPEIVYQVIMTFMGLTGSLINMNGQIQKDHA